MTTSSVVGAASQAAAPGDTLLEPVTVFRVADMGFHYGTFQALHNVSMDIYANQVTALYVGLPASEQASTVIISAYYGLPGALEFYGNPKLVPGAYSPQLSAYYWLPNNLTATFALMVDYQPSDVAWMCTSPTLIAHLTVPYQVAGLEQGAPVTLCQLKGPISTFWGRLRNFS